MVLKNQHGKVFKSEGLEVSTIGVRADKLELISEIFRNSIYTEKKLAPIRELIANAIEVHHEHNVDQPIEVWIEKTDEGIYSWHVRDHGKGLSKRNVFDVWGMYFESTKCDEATNKDGLGDKGYVPMGGFGVGSKSMFCITEEATVTSYFEGEKTVYRTFIDQGDTGVGVSQIAPVFKEPTNEHGIEVSFDIGGFSEAREFDKLTRFFIHHSRPETNIKFTDMDGECEDIPKLDKVVKFKGFNFCYNEMDGYSQLRIRMGDIVYKIPPEMNVFDGLKLRVGVIDVPVNSLTVPIHRESISDSKANLRFLKHIEKALTAKRKAALKRVKFNLESYSTLNRGAECGIFMYDLRDIDGINISPLLDGRGGKNIIVIVPQNQATRTWRNRIFSHFNGKQENIYTFTGNNLKPEDVRAKLSIVTDKFEVKTAKQLKLATGGRSKGHKEFVFRSGYHNRETMTVEDFHKTYAPKTFSLRWCKTLVDVRDRCIYNIGNRYQDGWQCCDSARKQLLALGWLNPNCQKVREKRAKIEEAAQIKREEEYALRALTDNHILNPKTRKLIKKQPKERQKKITFIVEKMEEGESLSAKFMRVANDRWAMRDHLDWQEIRTIYKKIRK